jgi:phosphoglycolate phosphatase-like HAD superfamily hydrolase
VLRKTDVEKVSALMVGDSPTDMRTAANGGIKGVAVGWGYRDMKGTEGLTVVNSAEELEKEILG